VEFGAAVCTVWGPATASELCLLSLCCAVLCHAAVDATTGQPAVESIDKDGLRTSQVDGRVVMGPVWAAAKAMGLCCGFPVEGVYAQGRGGVWGE
jgi:hypothetical protein